MTQPRAVRCVRKERDVLRQRGVEMVHEAHARDAREGREEEAKEHAEEIEALRP